MRGTFSSLVWMHLTLAHARTRYHTQDPATYRPQVNYLRNTVAFPSDRSTHTVTQYESNVRGEVNVRNVLYSLDWRPQHVDDHPVGCRNADLWKGNDTSCSLWLIRNVQKSNNMPYFHTYSTCYVWAQLSKAVKLNYAGHTMSYESMLLRFISSIDPVTRWYHFTSNKVLRSSNRVRKAFRSWYFRLRIL